MAEFLISRGRIGCVPGVDFGGNGEGYLRFCFARDRAELTGALDSMLGKVATAIYVLTGVIALYANYAGTRLAVVDWFVYASLVITLASGVHYVVLVFRGFTHEPEPRAGA